MSSARYTALPSSAAHSSSAPSGFGSSATSSAYVPPATSTQSVPLSKHKVVFVGNSGAGKTSIIKQFIYGTFDSGFAATVGIDFLAKTLYLPDRTCRLQIWDSAGQERFRSLIPSYIRDSSVAIVVYDVTSRASFEDASRWLEDVRAERGTDVLIALVGNKTDLAERRVVSSEEGLRKARSEGVMFLECSAKTGHNVKQLFTDLATALPGTAAPGAPGAAGGARGGAGGGEGGESSNVANSNVIDIKLGSASLAGGGAGGAGADAGRSGCCGLM